MISAFEIDRVPIIANRATGRFVDIDNAGVAAGAVTDQAVLVALEINRQRNAARDVGIIR